MDPDPDPALFVIDLQDPKKTNFKKKFFSAYYFYIYEVKKSYKTVGIKVFLTFFAW
jgi:hypothetical protein